MSKTSRLSFGYVPVEKLQRDPEQPRIYFDQQSQRELTDSIKEQGLLYPIIYREVEDENEEQKRIIVDGERRWRACRELGLTEIPAIKLEGDHEAVALIGNIVRDNLTAMEEALAVSRLKTSSRYTQVELGRMLGKAESTISEILAVVKLPEHIQNVAKENREWSRAKLLELAKKRKNTKAQNSLFERMHREIQHKPTGRISRDKIEATRSQIEILKSKLTRIQADEQWTEDDKSALRLSLEQLNEAIVYMLMR